MIMTLSYLFVFHKIERRHDRRSYQTFAGEQNVQSSTENECEHSGNAIEVITTSQVSEICFFLT